MGGSPKLQRELAQTADEQIQFAQNELAEVLETQIKNLEQYEISARLGLLRNYNRDEASPILRATPENEVQ